MVWRGECGFSSLLKQKIKTKNKKKLLRHLQRRNFFLKILCYGVFAKQKRKLCAANYYSSYLPQTLPRLTQAPPPLHTLHSNVIIRKAPREIHENDCRLRRRSSSRFPLLDPTRVSFEPGTLAVTRVSNRGPSAEILTPSPTTDMLGKV